jgi:type IV pilus assembly protein PilV
MKSQVRKSSTPAMPRSRGFSLVEVMVALIVCSVGMLGLAKMESLALSSTSVASGRSLAAIEASSLASMMHADRDYWATTLATGTPIPVDGTYTAATDCRFGLGAPCLPQAMAFYDLAQWAASMKTLLPGFAATITCTTTVNLPVSCAIQIQWAENAVAINKQQASATQNNMTALTGPNYILYVQP